MGAPGGFPLAGDGERSLIPQRGGRRTGAGCGERRVERGAGDAMWEFLASNLALGLVLLVIGAALVRWQRIALLDMMRVPERGWRIVAWVAFGLTVALLVWCSLADDWRKMFGELLDLRQEFFAERAVKVPVSGDVRAVTLALLVATLLLTGALFARYVGGYGLPIALVIVGFSSFFPLYLFRQRLDLGLVGIVINAPTGFSFGMLATLFYLAMDFTANVGLIAMSYAALVGLFALPMALVLDLLGRRDPPARPQASDVDFYATIRANVAARQAEADRLHGVRSEE